LLDLPSEVIDCRRKLDAARRQAESAIRRLVGCFNATGELLERTSTDDVQGARFGELVLRAIERGQESVKTEAHQGRFEVAADQAQNVWWAAVHEVRFLASARALVASQRGDAAQLQEAVAAFEGFLTDAESYWFLLPPGNLPPNDGTDGEPMPFSGTVRDLRRRIRSEAARLDPASVLVKWSPPDRLPEGSLDLVSVTGRSVVSEAYMMGKDLLEARPTMPESSPPSARLEWQLSRLQQAWSRVAPAVRYGLLTALTVVVSLLLLALLGIKEQYLDNPTFGSFGDYLKLFLWGFGVEMSTSKVLELVSGWGMFAESTE